MAKRTTITLIALALAAPLMLTGAAPSPSGSNGSIPIALPVVTTEPPAPHDPQQDGGVASTRRDDGSTGTDARELIIELERGAAIGLRSAIRASPATARLALPPTLRTLDSRFGVTSMRPVFADGVGTGRSLQRVKTAFAARQRRASGQPTPALDGFFLLELGAGQHAEIAAREYRKDPAVRSASPNAASRATDEFLAQQWALTQVDAACAWPTTTGDGVVVAVIDTGVDLGHPDLAPNLWVNAVEAGGTPGVDDDGNGFTDDVNGWDFANGDNDPQDVHGHGSHVAGIAAAVQNTAGIRGLAHEAEIMVLQALSDFGGGSSTWAADAMVYAADNGADVINLSLGGDGRIPLIETAVNYAHSLGVVVIAASGNDNVETYSFWPANSENALAIAAHTAADLRADYSNFGVKLDVAAPGGFFPPCFDTSSIISTAPDASRIRLEAGCPIVLGSDGAEYLSILGTSMAAPHASALAAMLLQLHPTWTNEEIRQAVRQGVVDTAPPGIDTSAGHGRIDACVAVTTFPTGSPQPPTASLTEPWNGTTLRGTVDVRGYADFAPGGSYELDTGEGQVPVAFTPVAGPFTIPVFGGILGTWDTRGLPDGEHVIRVVSTDATGESEDRNLVFVDNLYIERPRADELLDGSDTAHPILGQVPDRSGTLVSYTLEWQVAGSGSPTFLTSSSTAVEPVGLLHLWDLTPVPDGRIELILTADYGSFTDVEMVEFIVDQKRLPGWPQPLDTPLGRKSPAIADLDLDGVNELIVGATVFQPDGSVRAGWDRFQGVGRTDPAVVDIDADPQLEVVPLVFHDYLYSPALDTEPNLGAPVVYAYDHDKTEIWSFAVDNPATSAPSDWNHGIPSAVSAADVDGDSRLEIVFSVRFNYSNPSPDTTIFVLDAETGALEASGTAAGTNKGAIALVDVDGDTVRDLVMRTRRPSSGLFCHVEAFRVMGGALVTLPGWPSTYDECFANGEAEPVAADVDRDGDFEILVGHALFEPDGTMHPGWPRLRTYTTGAAGPIDPSDCELEVGTGGRFLELHRSYTEDGVFVASNEGGLGENILILPFGYANLTRGSVILADLDGDGDSDVSRGVEFAWGLPTGIPDYDHPLALYAADAWASGSPTPGFPRWVEGGVDLLLRSTAAVGDLNRDGLTDLAVTSNGQVYVWSLGFSYVESDHPWAKFQADLGNTGVYVAPPCTDPTGACCFGTSGACATITEASCVAAGGSWQGPGTNCLSTPCTPTGPGACCLPGDLCEIRTQEMCERDFGEWCGPLVTCNQASCIQGGCN